MLEQRGLVGGGDAAKRRLEFCGFPAVFECVSDVLGAGSAVCSVGWFGSVMATCFYGVGDVV